MALDDWETKQRLEDSTSRLDALDATINPTANFFLRNRRERGDDVMDCVPQPFNDA